MNCEQTVGAFALPGKGPGCISLVGIEGLNRDLHVIDEYESHSTNELVRHLFVFEDRRRPDGWFGNWEDRAVRHLLHDLNRDRGGLNDQFIRRREIHPRLSSLLEEPDPYQHLSAILEPLLGQNTKRLHLHESKAGLSLSELRPEEFHRMAWGEYPIVEALAMAVLELLNWEQDKLRSLIRPRRTRARDWNPLTGAEIRD